MRGPRLERAQASRREAVHRDLVDQEEVEARAIRAIAEKRRRPRKEASWSSQKKRLGARGEARRRNGNRSARGPPPGGPGEKEAGKGGKFRPPDPPHSVTRVWGLTHASPVGSPQSKPSPGVRGKRWTLGPPSPLAPTLPPHRGKTPLRAKSLGPRLLAQDAGHHGHQLIMTWPRSPGA